MSLNIHSQNFMFTFKHNTKLFKALFWEPHYTLRTELPLYVFTWCQMPHAYFNYITADVQISPCWWGSNMPWVCLWECRCMSDGVNCRLQVRISLKCGRSWIALLFCCFTLTWQRKKKNGSWDFRKCICIVVNRMRVNGPSPRLHIYYRLG